MGQPGEMRGMTRQKVLATVQILKNNENLGDAILVALGALFLLLPFAFYPLYLVPALAAVAGIAAYKHAPIGTLIGMLFAIPAMAYQAPVLAWVFFIALAIALFEVFDHWSTIAFLEIAVLAPFAPAPFNVLSGFLFLALGIAAMRFGSKHSFAVSLPAIFVVLLFSSLWLQQTASFITISKDQLSLYGPPMDELRNSIRPEVELNEVFSTGAIAIGSLFSVDNMKFFGPALYKIYLNTSALILQDSAIAQLGAWAAALFLCAFLPAKFDHRFRQTISSFSLFLVPAANFVIAPVFNNPFEPMSFAYCSASVAVIACMEYYGFALSRERMVVRRERQKAFDKFGLQDLGESRGVDSLEDIGGYGSVKAELHEAIIAPLKSQELVYTYGLEPPNGVLLFGPPGTGKTLMMKALAKEMNIGFYYVKCSELLSEFYGESEKNMTEIFTIARKKAPCVLFFDEIDAIGKRRDSYQQDDIAPRILSTLLEELDGFKSKKNVITIGATNAPDQLDPALMRPGRFDKIIYMPLPDPDARQAIFKVHLKKLPHDEDIDYARLASMTERFSGADIKNICTESSRLAAREAVASRVVVNISMKHLTTTIKKLKPSVSLDQLETYDKFRMDYERRSDAEEKKPDEMGVRWEDVAGLADVRAVLLEAIEMPLLHEDVMKEMDVKASKGLLLFGPPGCGKTMIVKAAANELKANFLTISGAELMRSRNRNAATVVKETFNRARESAPALVFIDEIEALAPNRDEFSGGILTELLQELDGVKELKNVMLIGATNKPSALDPAILRPGRFDKIIYIPPPDAPARMQIFTTNLVKFLKGLDLKKLSEATEGFSGADVSSVCQEVKMQLVRSKLKGKSTELTSEQVMKVVQGRRPSITKKDLRSYDEFKEEYGERR